VLGDCRLDSFGVGAIDNIHLFTVFEVVEGRNRSDTFSLHELGSIWGGISDNLDWIELEKRIDSEVRA
jgi:hypothetical protein